MSNCTRAECPSFATWVFDSSGFCTLVTTGKAETALITSPTTTEKPLSRFVSVFDWTSTLSVAGRLKPALARMCSAVAASPEAVSSCFSVVEPAAVPRSTAAAANASQPNVARFQCAPLHAAARDAALCLTCGCSPGT
jgi:hypothetical protein